MTQQTRNRPAARTRAPATTTPAATATTTTPAATTPPADQMAPAFHAQHDARVRSSALSSLPGPTRTQLPALMADWRSSVVDASAQDAAEAELAPVVRQVLERAEADKGEPLVRGEVRFLVRQVHQQNAAFLDSAYQAHLKQMDASPKSREQTIQNTVLALRPEVQKKKDPFTPLALHDPQARAKERVLWENADAMVLVDLFSPSPKALVVPKQPTLFPVDAPKALLDGLANLAAHVSDAFLDLGSPKPAGIWINPPQHLSVKQLHVHVLPELPDWDVDEEGEMTRKATRQFNKFYADLEASLAKRLGPST